MSQITHVLVTAAEGRLVPVPPTEAAAAGAATLRIEPGKVYRLPWSTYTRRRVNAGDLVLVNRGGTPVKTPQDAAVDASAKVTADGTLDADQRPDEVINAEAAKAAELEAKKHPASSPATLTNGKDR